LDIHSLIGAILFSKWKHFAHWNTSFPVAFVEGFAVGKGLGHKHSVSGAGGRDSGGIVAVIGCPELLSTYVNKWFVIIAYLECLTSLY
jgi:hypothetical protein